MEKVANQFLNIEPLEYGVANRCKSVSNTWNCWNMGLQTVANKFLNMEPLENGVANSCKSVSKYGNIGTKGFKQLQIGYEVRYR